MTKFYAKESHFTKELKEKIKRVTKKIRPIARTQNIVVQKMGDEILLYDLVADKALCLNDTSARIWLLLDGNKTSSEISDEISVQTKSLVSEEIVWLAVDQFQKDGLLETGLGDYEHFKGLSRREVIRKIGFTSAIMLPLVSSIIAPQAFMAQSVCVPGMGAGVPTDACNSDADCSNCNCTGTGEVICCAPGVSHANPLPTGQAFCATAVSCAASATATIRCCSTGTASPIVGTCPSPGQIACACD